MEVKLGNTSNDKLKIAEQSRVGKRSVKETNVDIKTAGVEVKSPMLEAMSLLRDIPEVRMDKVALAKKLIADPNYPSPEILDRIADALLGANTDSNDE